MDPSGNGAKPSKVEAIKIASQYLRTFVADEVHNGQMHFSEDAASVLKFHGSYQQDDRDLRTQMKREGKEKAFQFMVRVRIVGGRLNADQYLAMRRAARTVGNGTLRITTRQEFQLHGVLKDDLAATIRRVNESLLSTLAACGDVERNVLCCPAPARDAVRDAMHADAARFASHCAPRSSSYWDIWVDGEKVGNAAAAAPGPDPGADPRRRPGRADLRQGLPAAQVQDGLRPARRQLHRRPRQRPGLPGGRQGRQARRLQRPGRRRPGHDADARRRSRTSACRSALSSATTCSRSARRSSRSSATSATAPTASGARLKYMVHDWGLPAFRAKIEEYLGHALADPRRCGSTDVDDHLGWHEQGDGKLYLGIPSRTAGSRTTATSGWRSACGRSSRGTGPGSADLPAVDPAGRPRPGLAAGHRGAAGPVRHRARSSRSRMSAAGRWPARRCRLAAWPSPRPSGSCRRSWTSSRSSWPGSAWRTSGSRSA